VKTARGYSVPEIMVATTLGLLVITAALRTYTGMRHQMLRAQNIAEQKQRLNFALALIEDDILLSGYWGLHGQPEMLVRQHGIQIKCGQVDISDWAMSLSSSLEATDILPCRPFGKIAESSHIVTVRHASSNPTSARAGTVQIQTNHSAGRLFSDGSIVADGLERIHDLKVHSWHIDNRSSEPPMPSLRRLTLVHGEKMQNDEIMPGINDLRISFAVDSDADGFADRLAGPEAADTSTTHAVTLQLTAQPQPRQGLPAISATRTIFLRNRPIS